MRKNKKLVMAMAICLSVVTAVSAATFAWFTAHDTVLNPFDTAIITDGSVSIWEIFTEPDKWTPGTTVTKEVGAVNTGTGEVVVRMSLAEVLQTLENNGHQTNPMLKTFWSDDFEALKGDTPMGYSNERLRWGNDRNVATTGLATVDGITYGPYWTVYDADDFNSESSATPADFTLFYHRTMITSDAGVTASYEFLACVVIDGVLHQVRFWDVDGTDVSLDSDGALVLASGASLAETLKIALNNPTGTDGALYKDKVTFGDAYIGQYNKAALVSVDWLAEIPENADMTFDAANNKMTIEALSDEFGWIILNFGNISATPTDGLWYYNEDDGYFYYMGVLGAGQATPYFLESVTLSGDATGAYSGLHFDLIVNMEAIQNTKSAVESDTGWDLSLTAPPALDAFQIKLLTFLK